MDRYRESHALSSSPYIKKKLDPSVTESRYNPPDIINILADNDKLRNERRRRDILQVSRSNVYGKISREEN